MAQSPELPLSALQLPARQRQVLQPLAAMLQTVQLPVPQTQGPFRLSAVQPLVQSLHVPCLPVLLLPTGQLPTVQLLALQVPTLQPSVVQFAGLLLSAVMLARSRQVPG